VKQAFHAYVNRAQIVNPYRINQY